MKIINEFKDFIAKGNAFDLAIGVIIGGAFGPIVNSMVTDIIMPTVSLGVGSVDFKNLYLPLSTQGIEAAKAAIAGGTPLPSLDKAKEFGSVIAYGNLLNVIVNFVFLMFGVFILMKIVNAVRRPAPAPAPEDTPEPATPPDIALLSEIRDLLKNRP